MRLLVTRPLPDAERTAAMLRARGHEVIVAPLMRVETVATDIAPEHWAAVLMTSAKAARAIAAHAAAGSLRLLPVFAVGAQTAQAACDAGFSNVTAADGGVDGLAVLVCELLVAKQIPPTRMPLLYLAAEQRSGDLAGALAAHGFTVATIVIYRTVAATKFPPDMLAALDMLDGVLHFSQRSAATYVDCAEASGRIGRVLAPPHYCLSDQVAAPLIAAGAATVRIAPQPNEAALVDLIAAD